MWSSRGLVDGCLASPLLVASTSRAFLVVGTVIVTAASSFAEKTPTAQQWQGELPI
jgi:hypothetical protein